jgi:hypothetical protein
MFVFRILWKKKIKNNVTKKEKNKRVFFPGKSNKIGKKDEKKLFLLTILAI